MNVYINTLSVATNVVYWNICSLLPNIVYVPLKIYVRGEESREGGGQGLQTLLWKIEKRKGNLAILVRIPWKITELPSRHSMLAMVLARHLNDVSLAGIWWPAFSGIWFLSPSPTKKKLIAYLSYLRPPPPTLPNMAYVPLFSSRYSICSLVPLK